MKRFICIGLLLLGIEVQSQSVQSPSKEITLNFFLSENGKPIYSVFYKNKLVVLQSNLGIKLKADGDLNTNFLIDSIVHKEVNETWQPVLGEQSYIKNNYNQMIVALSQSSSNKKINIIFRVFNEGISFRYEFPKQEKLN